MTVIENHLNQLTEKFGTKLSSVEIFDTNRIRLYIRDADDIVDIMKFIASELHFTSLEAT